MDVLEKNDITVWRNAFLKALNEPIRTTTDMYAPAQLTAL